MLNSDIELLFDLTFDAKHKATCVACKESCDGGFAHTATNAKDTTKLPACKAAATYDLTKSYAFVRKSSLLRDYIR